MLNVLDIHELLLSFGTDVSRSFICVDRWICFIDVEHGVSQAHRNINAAEVNWMMVISNPNIIFGLYNIKRHDNRFGQLLCIAFIKYLFQLPDHA